jgi:iron complex outermembrane receptor protein
VAVYLDAESDLTSRLLLSGAVRYENYSDFGGTTTGKVAGRYKLAEQVVFRGAAATGFRAPSLQQSFYSATATNFINGVPFDVKTAPVGSEIARTLGARPLRPETSVNLSGGVALEPVRNLALTVDYYRITIEDRVVLSENFTGAQVAALLQPLGASGARYFTNAIDTRTNGVDVVANYGLGLGAAGYLRLTGGYNNNRTRATRVASTPPELGNQSETLFGRVERSRLEEGQPRNNVLGSVDYSWRRFGVVVRGQRFGEVTTRATVGSEALDQTFSSRWIADLALNARLLRATTLTVGVDNLFDTYPDQNSNTGNPRTNVAGNANFGIFPYSQFSPFGFNGRFLYARVTAGF